MFSDSLSLPFDAVPQLAIIAVGVEALSISGPVWTNPPLLVNSCCLLISVSAITPSRLRVETYFGSRLLRADGCSLPSLLPRIRCATPLSRPDVARHSRLVALEPPLWMMVTVFGNRFHNYFFACGVDDMTCHLLSYCSWSLYQALYTSTWTHSNSGSAPVGPREHAYVRWRNQVGRAALENDMISAVIIYKTAQPAHTIEQSEHSSFVSIAF